MRRSSSLSLCSLIVASLAAPLAAAQQIPPAEPPGPHAQPLPTPDFITAVAQADEFEMQEGRLAAPQAQSAAVRRAAEEMVRDHARAASELRAAVLRAGLPAPRSPGLDIGQHQRLEQLRAASGPAFDRSYVDAQVRLHARLSDQIQAYLTDGAPGPVRDAAARIAPVVARHLAIFRRLQGAVG